MNGWFKIALPLGIAAVLVAVLSAALVTDTTLAAKGGNKGTPTLTVAEAGQGTIGQAGAGEPVTITGQGFPRNTAVFVVITEMPSILVESDSSGSFVTGGTFTQAGSYTLSACFLANGGRWDCSSTPSVTLQVVQ